MPENSRLYNFVARVTYAEHRPFRIIGTVYGTDEATAEANIIDMLLDKPDRFEIVRLEIRPKNSIISLIATAADDKASEDIRGD